MHVLLLLGLIHVGCNRVPMDVGHLPLLAWLPGTLCQRTCGIRMFLRTVTGSHWRRFYFRSTSVFSALEFFLTRMRYINLHLTLTFTTTPSPNWGLTAPSQNSFCKLQPNNGGLYRQPVGTCHRPTQQVHPFPQKG